MTTYRITFYPGMVLPYPYYVTVDSATTDTQSIVDILADRLTAEGSDGLFDDDYEEPDDMVTIAGNEGRRLITGGCLQVEEVLPYISSDVKHLLKTKAHTDYPFGTVRIGFDDFSDETEFDDVSSIDDLEELWVEFCKENNLSIVDIDYIEMDYFNKQVRTERGLIYVKGICSEDCAYKAGYSYSFTSKALNLDVYSKILDDIGHRRNFVLVRTEES